MSDPYKTSDGWEEWHHKQHNPRGEGTYEEPRAYIPGLGTVRECRVCGCLVAGGPTCCKRCAKEGDGAEGAMQSMRETASMVGALLRRLGMAEVRLTAAEMASAPQASAVWFTTHDDGSGTIKIPRERPRPGVPSREEK